MFDEGGVGGAEIRTTWTGKVSERQHVTNQLERHDRCSPFPSTTPMKLLQNPSGAHDDSAPSNHSQVISHHRKPRYQVNNSLQHQHRPTKPVDVQHSTLVGTVWLHREPSPGASAQFSPAAGSLAGFLPMFVPVEQKAPSALPTLYMLQILY